MIDQLFSNDSFPGQPGSTVLRLHLFRVGTSGVGGKSLYGPDAPQYTHEKGRLVE